MEWYTSMEVKLRTLTPLWTGDVDRDSSRMKETGILGSLRSWYEAWVRAHGGYACDPTSDDRCVYKESLNSICHVCRSFGCTGWSRKFKIEGTGLKTVTLFFVSSLSSNRRWLEKISENHHNACYGQASLKIIGLDKEVENTLLAILWLIAEYGGLGAKSQNGFGQIRLENIDMNKVSDGFAKIRELVEEDARRIGNSLWQDFSNFFILKFRIDEDNSIVQYYLSKPSNKFGPYYVGSPSTEWKKNFIPCSFDIRYKGEIQGRSFGLRNRLRFQKNYGKDIAEKLFGYSKSENRQGSRVFVSHLYKESSDDKFYYLKVWGFVPKDVSTRVETPADFRRDVKEHIMDIFRLKESHVVIDKMGEELEEALK